MTAALYHLRSDAAGRTGLNLMHVPGGAQRRIDESGVFIFVRSQALTSFVPPSLALSPEEFIITNQEMHASLPGIVAAGHVRVKLRRQVATTVGDGATAAHSASLFLDAL